MCEDSFWKSVVFSFLMIFYFAILQKFAVWNLPELIVKFTSVLNLRFMGSGKSTHGRFFGVNLKVDYNPNKNSDDAIIERVAVGVELGTI